MPRLALVLTLLLVAPLLPVSVAEPAPDAPRVRVAVIDTGIDPAHVEFAPGQVVAWWAFTSEGKSPGAAIDPFTVPEAQRAWDPAVAPFDLNGHGTATASLVAGLNTGRCSATRTGEKLSFAPGADLIIAKLSSEVPVPTGGTETKIDGDLATAIRWAVAMGADVISISIGVIAPIPIHYDESALREARDAGTLVVVSAGNGLGNAGLAPYPAWTSSYGNSRHVLAVGGGDRDGKTAHTTTGNLDPDVTSWSEAVCAADVHTGGYRRASGTSFSAPLVAGMAAHAMALAREHCGAAAADPDHIERLLLLSGSNNLFVPYAREGTGYLLDAEWPTVSGHARACTLPDAQARGPHAYADLLYHDVVVKQARNTPFL